MNQTDYEQKLEGKKVLVTGATGAIAPLLVRELVNKHCEVVCLVRNIPPDNLLPASVKLVVGDLRDRQTLENASKNVEIVFHLGAKLHLNNPSEELNREYRAINVEATQNLLEFSRPFCQKFIFFSTINVYGASDGKIIFDEKSKTNPQGIYAETKAEAEKIVLNNKNGVVLRLAAVYGRRMKGNYPKLLNALRKGRFVFIGDAQNRRTVIHENDVVKAAILIARNPVTDGQIYNLTDGEIHTFREIVKAMCVASGKKIPQIKLPLLPIKKVFAITEKTGKFIGKDLSFGAKALEKLTEDIAVSGEKIKNEIDFHADFDLEKGWKSVVSEYE
jgi:UDP-glucose 4-epimerase